jgi:hypothetical protein
MEKLTSFSETLPAWILHVELPVFMNDYRTLNNFPLGRYIFELEMRELKEVIYIENTKDTIERQFPKYKVEVIEQTFLKSPSEVPVQMSFNK